MAVPKVHYPPERANLPLPRELRDEIHSYLLDSRVIKYIPANPRHATGSRSTKSLIDDLQLATLAVNKTIGAEATEYFHKHNKLVKVDFDMPGFYCMLHTSNVPILADRNVEDYKHHTLAIALKWDQPPQGYSAQSSRNDDTASDKGSLLMLLEDVARLCSMLKFLCAYTLPDTVYISAKRSTEVIPHKSDVSDLVELKIEVRETVVSSLSISEQDGVLRSIRAITGAGYKLSLLGFSDAGEVQTVSARMAPRTIWVSAVAWDQLDTALRRKQEADSLIVAGNTGGALTQYDVLLDYWMSRPTSNFLLVDKFSDCPDRASAVIRLHVFAFDLCMSRAAVNLARGGDLNKFDGDLAVLKAQVFDRADMIPFWTAKMLLCFEHFELLLKLIKYTPRYFLGSLASIHESVASIESSSEHYDHVSNDVAIIRSALQSLNQNTLPRPLRGILNQLSVRNGPIQVFNSQDQCDVGSRPAGLIEWQDLNHIAAMTTEEKEAILKMQKENGIVQTTF